MSLAVRHARLPCMRLCLLARQAFAKGGGGKKAEAARILAEAHAAAKRAKTESGKQGEAAPGGPDPRYVPVSIRLCAIFCRLAPLMILRHIQKQMPTEKCIKRSVILLPVASSVDLLCVVQIATSKSRGQSGCTV
jgi:hypothetical protein